MRLAFRSIALFNIATSLWLTVMFLILRHANFGPRAAVAIGDRGILRVCVLRLAAHGPAVDAGGGDVGQPDARRRRRVGHLSRPAAERQLRRVRADHRHRVDRAGHDGPRHIRGKVN